MQTLEQPYDMDLQEQNFALLVAARVNEIRSGSAQVIDFKPIGGIHYTEEQRKLMFADKIAQAVCAHLETGE
jgi:predicted RNA-binding protein (virulence factor B family)